MRKIRYYDIWRAKQNILGKKDIGPINNRLSSKKELFETTLDAICETSTFDDQEKAYFVQKVRTRLQALDLESEHEIEKINPQLCLEDSEFYLEKAVDSAIEYAFKLRLRIMKQNPNVVVIDCGKK